MSEKQLDFYNIFDEANKKPAASEIQPEEIQPEVKKPIEEKRKTLADYLGQYSAEELELRTNLLDSNSRHKPDDFLLFFDELVLYNRRLERIKETMKSLAAGEEKDRLYGILVNPEDNDKPEYRESAKLFNNYQEAKKNDLQAAAEKYALEQAAARRKRKVNDLTPSSQAGEKIISGGENNFGSESNSGSEKNTEVAEEIEEDEGPEKPWESLCPGSHQTIKNRK
jgi:hypothetical protein